MKILGLAGLMCVVSLSSVMAAGPITPTRDSLKMAVLRQLNENTTFNDQIDSNKVYGSLNEGVAAVCRDLPALERLDTIVLSKTTEGTALAADFLRLKAVFRIKGDTMRLPLILVDPDSASAMTPRKTKAVQDKADIESPAYAYSYGGRLFTYPKSALTVDSFLVYYYAMDDKLISGTDSLVIDDAYLTAVKNYACYWLKASLEQYDKAAWWKAQYDAEVNAVGKDRRVEGKK